MVQVAVQATLGTQLVDTPEDPLSTQSINSHLQVMPMPQM